MELRIFVEPQQGATYDDQLRVALAAEELGFGAFFRSDHYLHMSGDGLPGPTDSWVTLAGLARETSTIRLGTLMSSATFRHPGPLAISVAQVDQMSGGRVELGLGAGWFGAEHEAYAIPFPDTGERFDRLEEQLAIVTGMWRTPVGDRFAYDGTHHRVADSPGLPKPAQERLPILVGGHGKRRTPALAAEHADELNVPFAGLDDTGAMFDRVRAACEDRGRGTPPALSVAQVLCVGRDEGELTRRADRIGRGVDELRTNGAAGSAQEVVDRLAAFGELGATRAYLQVLDLADLDQLALVADEVAPQLR